jgi:hypothetical protein
VVAAEEVTVDVDVDAVAEEAVEEMMKTHGLQLPN